MSSHNLIASSDNSCGECTACCHRLPIPEVTWMGPTGKPLNTMCDKNCNGCTIYDSRPKVCADFKCLWLIINSVNNSLPVDLRPDQCGVMVSGDSQDGKASIFLDELAEDTFDIAHMTPAQARLMVEIITLIQNQTMPTELFLHKYNWETLRINIQMEQRTT